MSVLWNRIMAGLAALALLGALGAGWYISSIRAENKRLGGAVQTLTVDLATAQELRATDQLVAEKHVATVAAMTTIQRRTDAALKAALRKNRVWADQNVPPDVAAALGVPSTPAP